MRSANEVDFTEDLYLTIRELVEVFALSPRTIRRYVNQSLKAIPPALVRDRVWTEAEKAAGRSLPETEGGGLRVFAPSFRACNEAKTSPSDSHGPRASARTRAAL